MYNCVIYGATGACGREVVEVMNSSKSWSKIYIVLRRMIPEFEELKNDRRFEFFLTENIMDQQTLMSQHIKSNKIDAVFNFLGTRVKVGEELFRKIDKEDVIESAHFANKLGARLFSHISAKGANANSWFLYMRVKGECINELKNVPVPNLSIFKPGLLLDRNNDYRFGEKVASCVPFIDKITTKTLATKIVKDAELVLGSDTNRGFKIYEHSQIENL